MNEPQYYSRTTRFKVLLIESGIYNSIGGGQSFYKKLIDQYPNVDFYCFLDQPVGRLPSNVHEIRRKSIFNKFKFYASDFSDSLSFCFRMATAIAEAVEGMEFDIVEYTDYMQVGIFLRPAFATYHVKVQKFVLGLHGVLSESFERSWFEFYRDSKRLSLLRKLEKLQMDVSDVAYTISPAYAQEVKQKYGLSARIIDVKQILDPPQPKFKVQPQEAVQIYFIGRLEKRKGIDLAVEMVSALPVQYEHVLNIVGPDEVFHGQRASDTIANFAQERGVKVQFLGVKNKAEMQVIYKSRSVVVLPSRYDTFNLVAWEAIALGAVTFIGRPAGIVSYLKTEGFHSYFYEIDTLDLTQTVTDLINVIENYDGIRSRLNQMLATYHFVPQFDLLQAYSSDSIALQDRIQYVEVQYRGIIQYLFSDDLEKRKNLSNNFKSLIIKSLKSLGLFNLAKRLLHHLQSPKQIINKMEQKMINSSLYHFREWVFLLVGLQFRDLPEVIYSELKKKPLLPRFFRSFHYSQLAYYAAQVENYEVAAAYGIRALRWSEGHVGNLIETQNFLRKAGYAEEVLALEMMFQAPEKIVSYLEDRIYRLMTAHDNSDLELRVDHRPAGFCARACVIVSAYSVGKKFSHFAKNFVQQSLFLLHQLELVIVDSGSPEGVSHFKMICEDCDRLQIPYVAVRSPKRETIQSAWNRGISLASADYLTFLGVDEANTRKALEELCDYLDKNQQIDWVTGDSLVTEVNADGEWIRDVMRYKRTDLTRADHILECCYFSYVGALYRRQIHDRAGYYDPTFRAAGDTEFKNRIQPFVKVGYIPKLFGIFLNYPEERTTQSPRAEIEDLRAWYLFRSCEGLKYLTKNYSKEELRDLQKKSFSYRKSYCSHISYDFEIAANLKAAFVAKNLHEKRDLRLLMLGDKYSQKLIRLELSSTRRQKFYRFLFYKKSLRGLSKLLSRLGLPNLSQFHILHENRFEQHSNIWPL